MALLHSAKLHRIELRNFNCSVGSYSNRFFGTSPNSNKHMINQKALLSTPWLVLSLNYRNFWYSVYVNPGQVDKPESRVSSKISKKIPLIFLFIFLFKIMLGVRVKRTLSRTIYLVFCCCFCFVLFSP